MTNSENAQLPSNEQLRTALQLLVHRASEELGGFHSLVTLAEEILEMVPAHETGCTACGGDGSDARSVMAARLRQNAADARAIIQAGQIIHPTVELVECFESAARMLDGDTSETLPPRITVMDDGRAMGGSDVCHTCAAHCTVINDMQTALRGLYWDNVDYLTLNKLGGMQNHWMRAARMALGVDVDDVRPSQKAKVGETLPETNHE